MAVARSLLERYTMLLLTASKTLLRHPECISARETRDGVFKQMRSAMQLIGVLFSLLRSQKLEQVCAYATVYCLSTWHDLAEILS